MRQFGHGIVLATSKACQPNLIQAKVISRLTESKNLSDNLTKPPALAASLILLRPAPRGFEVFMVERPIGGAFSGALVFPGGRVDESDHAAELKARAKGINGLSEEQGAARIAALREAFEEAGILLALSHGAPLSGEAHARLAAARQRLRGGAVRLETLLAEESALLDCGALTHIAHWVTPANVSKRFDTHFFVAEAPEGQVGAHDGEETVSSLWLTPEQALASGQEGRHRLMFPTKMNLMRLAQSETIAHVVAAAVARPIVRVEPQISKRDGKVYVSIPKEADYPLTEDIFGGG